MFKLKIINKPKMIKMKCNIEFPDVVLANFQEKEVTPTKEIQEIKADQQYDGLSKVVVNAIPSEYIVPSGDITITASGTYDVKDKENAIVDIKEKQLGTKTITENGTYKATDDNLDGYSEVEVATSGVDINDYFYQKEISQSYSAKPNWTKLIKKLPGPLTLESGANANYMFKNFYGDSLPDINITGATSCYEMFGYCENLTTIPAIDTSLSTEFLYMFSHCSKLKSIPKLNASSVLSVYNMFDGTDTLENLGGFENLGQSYLTTESANNNQYSLKLNSNDSLTHESLMNVINNLYDIKSKGCNAQKLILGTTNINKLTSEEIALATEKGFSVS